MRGEHTPRHMAALVAHLPHDCAINRSADADAAWTLNDVLVATLINMFSKKDAPLIGPRYMTHRNVLEARSMVASELMAELTKQRSTHGN